MNPTIHKLNSKFLITKVLSICRDICIIPIRDKLTNNLFDIWMQKRLTPCDKNGEIMKIVWGNPEDVTLFPYIMDRLAARGKPCQKNTLIVLLSRLMNKGFLSAKKIGRRNEYTTLVSEAEYQTAQTKNFLDKIYEGSAKGLVSNLIMGDLLTDAEYEDLRKLLEKGK